MALTQSDWIPQQGIGNSKVRVWKCTVAQTTAENDAYTKPTPVDLDTNKPFTVLMSAADTPDGQALPVDLWGGYSDSFALSGDGANVVATNGVKIKQILDDAVLAVSPLTYMFHFDPELPVADVVTVAAIGSGLKVRIPKLPRFVINLNGGSTLAATTVTYYLIQQD